jgi:hypothetical protein
MKISRIEIETEEGRILVTVEQAKKLHNQLNELFGKNTKIIDRTITRPDDQWSINPPWQPTQPVWCGTSI